MGQSPLPTSCVNACTIRCTATIAQRNRGASPITTPAWMCIRFLDGCWQGNSPKCGNSSGEFPCQQPPNARTGLHQQKLLWPPERWEQLGRPKEFLLVEAGAGVGRLATHI